MQNRPPLAGTPLGTSAHPRARPLPRLELTKLETATLISVFRLEGDVPFGVSIHDDIEGFLSRPVSIAAVYAALDRLERRRLLSTTISAPLAVQGGRSKKLYALTASGRSAIKHEQREATHIWWALPPRFNRST